MEDSCGITSETQSRLVVQALEHSFNNGLSVHAVVADGTATNPATMELLGAKFNGDGGIDGTLNQEHTQGNEVYFKPDAVHMLKLARNALAHMEVLVDEDGNKIKWDHIVKLHEIQARQGLKLANKLGQRHINFERCKMKVAVAAQCLSKSVADAIRFLRNCDLDGFSDAQGTIKFIETIDSIFDLLNSKNLFASGLKQPLRLK